MLKVHVVISIWKIEFLDFRATERLKQNLKNLKTIENHLIL